jgi:hypothetical protein
MSRTFKDTNGRDWLVTVNVATVKRIKEKLNIDLLDKLGIQLLEGIAADPIRLADVLYVIVEAQAAAVNPPITDVDFGSALSGDSLEEASVALMEAIADFFPSARRKMIQDALGKVKEVEKRLLDRAATMLASDQLNEQIEKILSESLPASGQSSISPPAQSA